MKNGKGRPLIRLKNGMMKSELDLHALNLLKNRVLKKALEMLEPYVVKVTCTVLRGACRLVTVLWAGNSPRLPDYTPSSERLDYVTKYRSY
ncbi:MAG: hypothetical protein OMM_10581 [Candidatus Magnetoglobus multicellularis str. Araruama]|uniref:Uncharacterized protein n=1 Tax=Candidatus Magnetoglobus multicellularis str. Araruama TaxID=890399 RepID=A0A1V1P0L1_9BACT|nr:MAG: hypothetical protein OMM_10581 [Candidatus Magnetoglobus multicellularis str. Araruama]